MHTAVLGDLPLGQLAAIYFLDPCWITSDGQSLSARDSWSTHLSWEEMIGISSFQSKNADSGTQTLFDRNPLESPAGKCLWAAGEPCTETQREMSTRTGTCCSHICVAIVLSHHTTHLRRYFSLHFDRLILSEGADITASHKDWRSTQPNLTDKDQNYAAALRSITNLSWILFLHRRRKYWSPKKGPMVWEHHFPLSSDEDFLKASFILVRHGQCNKHKMFIINTPKYKNSRDVVEGLLSNMKNRIAQSNSQRKHHKLEHWHIKCIVQVLFRDTI